MTHHTTREDEGLLNALFRTIQWNSRDPDIPSRVTRALIGSKLGFIGTRRIDSSNHFIGER
jgi:hypothetical protein